MIYFGFHLLFLLSRGARFGAGSLREGPGFLPSKMSGDWQLLSDVLRCPVVNGHETVQVSRLHNSSDFGLELVAIVDEGNQYKLVVLNIGDFECTLFSRSYNSLIAAKCEFLRRFVSTKVDIYLNLSLKWTPFYFSYDELDYFTLYAINQLRLMK